jgi:tetratricopeptide (TPR) repeat protein
VADPTGDQTVREQAYSDAMGALSKKFPEDLDVATLYAESLMNLRPWRLYKKDGTPEPGTDKIVASLESVMKRDPSHPGANHYYIHAVEASKSPDRALPQAGRLETLVPGAGHLVHMPAHIYIRTGQYAKSAKSNADAAGVDEKYFKATGATDGLYPMMYYTHNLQFESAAAMFAGNLAQARSAAERTVRYADPIADQMVMVEPFAAQDLTVLVRFGQWPEILKARAPAPSRLLQTAVYHFAHGAALAATGKIAEAESDLAALRAAAAKIKKDEMIGSSNTVVDVTAVAIADLGARIADAKGDTAAAIKGFTAAIAAEDKLGYNEPPDWLNPERERLGAVLLKAGRFAEAEKVFRTDLEKNIGNPRSLYGLYRALEGQKKAAAAEAKASFDKGWAGADVTLGDDLYGTRR